MKGYPAIQIFQDLAPLCQCVTKLKLNLPSLLQFAPLFLPLSTPVSHKHYRHMAQVPQSTIDTLAAAVYESCLKAPSDQLFSISELQSMVPGKNNLEVTQRVLNELLRTRSLSALTQGNQTVFKAAARDYADK